MKILHVITGIKDGGAEGAMTRLIAATPMYRHHVVSLTGDGHHSEQLRDLMVPTHLFDVRGPAKFVQTLARLSSLVRRERPDVVQCWMYHANLIGGITARVAGVRAVVWNVRSQYSPDWSWALRSIFAANARLSRLMPRHIVACSEEAQISHIGRGYDATRMQVIGNGLDLSRFRRDESARASLRAELGIRNNEFLLGRVGRFVPQKDFPTLFEALAILRAEGAPLRILIVGRDTEPGAARFDELVNAAGVGDLLIRIGARADVETVMNAIDVHVSSSTIEGFPNVLAEAMACGTPCVTTPSGAAAQIVGNCGWVVPQKAPMELTSAIRCAHREWDAEPSQWEQRRLDGQQHIACTYTMEAMAEAYMAVWHEVSQGTSGNCAKPVNAQR